MQKERVSYKYSDKEDILEATINIRGFFKTLGYFLFFITSFPIVLFLTIILILGISKGIVLMPNYIVLIILAVFLLYIGSNCLYQWLYYNFSREVLILNNKEKYIEYYNHQLFRCIKIKKFNYYDFSNIIVDSTLGRNPDYYITLVCKNKNIRIGIVNDGLEGADIVKRLNEFIVK